MKNQDRVSLISKFFSVALIALLTACGGGGGSGDNPPLEPSYQGSGLEIYVETEDGFNIGVIRGETSTHRLSLLKADENISAEIAIVTENRWIKLIEIDGITLLSIDASQNWNDSTAPVTVIVTNLDNGLTAQTELLISLLDTKLVASGTLSSGGGVISSNGGAFGIRIPQGQLTNPLGVEIWTALSPSRQTHVRIKFDRDVSNETATMSLVSNLNAFDAVSSAGSVASAQSVTSKSITEALSSTKTQSAAIQSTETVYPLTNVDASYPGWFLGTGPRILNQDLQMSVWLESCDAVKRSQILCLIYDPDAANLTTIAPTTEASDAPNAIQPVLFIHGYKRKAVFGGGVLGGGATYWGEFPRLVSEMQGPNGESYLPYEFRWRTNASFSVVADDLANAIVRIHSLYGKPVRIIAHSYGGLLIRTLVQGLAERYPEFQSMYIRSILTLGTPHSGIFDKITTIDTINFPDGQDQESFNLCGQVSCLQGGEDVIFGKNILEMTKAGEQGGIVAALAASSFPESLPMVVGIGLKREDGLNEYYDSGDGLITFEGQRFAPSLNAQPLKSCNTDTGGRTSEIVLGAFNANGEYDSDARPDSAVINNVAGYAHSAPTAIGKSKPHDEIELSEAFISCDTVGDCPHASLRLFKSMIDFPQDFCDVIPPNPMPTLAGSRVSVTLHYPVLGLVATVPYEKMIDSQIEIPAGVIQEIETYSNRLIPVDIDIGATTIDLQYLTRTSADNTSFNGYVFDFEEGSPVIVGASLDELSTFTSDMVEVTFEPHRVIINFSGIQINSDSRILVNLQFDTGRHRGRRHPDCRAALDQEPDG
jgi:hypothetical protein